MSVETLVRGTDLTDAASAPPCRFCGTPLRTTFVDLGPSPLCQTIIKPDRLDAMEPFYPLHVRVCEACLLVQLPAYVPPEDIFTEYAYFSSYSASWVAHARAYAEQMIGALDLGPDHLVVELASNDGYLLQHFAARGIPVLGVEPARNVAEAARERGVRTVSRFFGAETAHDLVATYGHADLVPANNVLAHVPDINDFVEGVRILLGPRGLATFEFPHLLTLIHGAEFDTIYHEHYSYLSLWSAEQVLAAHGLRVADLESLPTHGGSLRLHVRHADDPSGGTGAQVERQRRLEHEAGLDSIEGYRGFRPAVEAVKRDLLAFLIDARRSGRRVAGYGAPGKGNTLLNYCGIRTDLLEFTVDRNPYKQGAYLPGTRIPVLAPTALAEKRPDFVLILPWNLREEIAGEMEHIRGWGGRFVVPIPRLEIF